MAKVIIIILLVIGVFVLFKDKSEAPTNIGVEEATTEESAENVQAKEFSIDATNFSFAPKNLTVNKGDTVKITLTRKLGMHDLKIDEFGVATKVLKAGESDTVTFVADKTGTFEFYCSVGTHREMGMVGTLTVN